MTYPVLWAGLDGLPIKPGARAVDHWCMLRIDKLLWAFCAILLVYLVVMILVLGSMLAS